MAPKADEKEKKKKTSSSDKPPKDGKDPAAKKDKSSSKDASGKDTKHKSSKDGGVDGKSSAKDGKSKSRGVRSPSMRVCRSAQHLVSLCVAYLGEPATCVPVFAAPRRISEASISSCLQMRFRAAHGMPAGSAWQGRSCNVQSSSVSSNRKTNARLCSMSRVDRLLPVHSADPSKSSKKQAADAAAAAAEEEPSAGTARQRAAEMKLAKQREAERKQASKDSIRDAFASF